MPIATRATHQCPLCDVKPFLSRAALGSHLSYVHGRRGRYSKSKPIVLPESSNVEVKTVEACFIPSPPVPIPCATCIARASDVEKGLIVVLIRAGMSIERAQKTVKEMQPVLKRNANGNGQTKS